MEEEEFFQTLLKSPPPIDPMENLQFRLKMRNSIKPHLDKDSSSVISILMNYQLDYLQIIAILRINSYIYMCRVALKDASDPGVLAFIHYSILALSLDISVQYSEFITSRDYLMTHEDSIPRYLKEKISFLLEFTQEFPSNPLPVDYIQEDQPPLIIETPEFNINYSELFGIEPKQNNTRELCRIFHQNLVNNNDSDAILKSFLEATSNITDFSHLFNYFSQMKDIYAAFARIVLAYVNKSTNREKFGLFSRQYTFDEVEKQINQIISNIIGDLQVVEFELPDNFEIYIGHLLDNASNFSSDPNFHLLAAAHYRNRDSAHHFIDACTTTYTRIREVPIGMAFCGLEFLGAIKQYTHYACFFLQFFDDQFFEERYKSYCDSRLINISKCFWNIKYLKKLNSEIASAVDFISGFISKNINDFSTMQLPKDACIMRYLNEVNHYFGVKSIDIFNVGLERP